MHFNRSIVLICFILISALGCANTPPSSYYVLANSKLSIHEDNPTKDIKLGVGPIKLPGRLDRAHIVTRTGEHSIKIHEFSRWGDSLQRQFEEALVENISLHIKTSQVVLYPWDRALRPTYQITLVVRRFEGNFTAGTTIDVVWQVIDVKSDQLIQTYHFTKTVPSSEATMEAYINSQSQALRALSQSIVNEVSKL